MLVTQGSVDGWHGVCGFCGANATGMVCPECGICSGASYDLDAEPMVASWSVIVKQYDASDCFITIPQPVLDKMDWVVGDDLVWTLNDDGSATVRKA